MRKNILLLVITVISVCFQQKVLGKVKHYKPIYIGFNDKDLQIKRVSCSDTATVLKFLFKPQYTNKLKIYSSCYLLDDDFRKRHAKYATGITLDSTYSDIPEDGMEFSITFEPLNETYNYFDFDGGAYKSDATRLFCIHDRKNSINFDTMNYAEPILPDNINSLYSEGNVTFYGNLVGAQTDVRDNMDDMHFYIPNKAFGIDIQQTPYLNNKYVNINRKGDFSSFFVCDRPIFGNLRFHIDGEDMAIPTYINPNDTINLTVVFDSTKSCRLKYKEQPNNGNNLRKLPPIAIHMTKSIIELEEDEFIRIIGMSHSESMVLAKYLSWRYKLSAFESRLVENRFRMEHTFWMAYYYGNLVAMNKTADLNGNYIKNNMRFIKNMPYDDPLIYMDPLFDVLVERIQSFVNKYADIELMHTHDDIVNESIGQDSLCNALLKDITGCAHTPFIAQAVMLQDLKNVYYSTPVYLSDSLLNVIIGSKTKRFTHQFLVDKASRMGKLLKESRTNSYDIPEVRGKDILSNIIHKHYGKYVELIFFRPEPEAIAKLHKLDNIRIDFKDSDKLKVIFVAVSDDRNDKWLKSIENWLADEDLYIIDKEKEGLLKDLFNKKILDYETIDPKGRIMKEPLDYYDEFKFRLRLRKLNLQQ